ncbi:MAG TPA: glycosyltransferase family 4 protein [Phnomibacter sp.]|nr:glycosyltransferase family 4 protein [Phnomibacter sp.]
MRIVYFYQYFGTTQGGWSTRVYEMCKRWVAAGHQVTVITSPYDKSDVDAFKGFTKKYTVEGIEVIVLNGAQSNKHSKLRRMFTFIQYIILANFYALKLNYDVAIASSGPITVGFLGLVAKWVRRKKFVLEVRDLWPEGSVQLGVLRNKLLIKMAFWFEHLCYKKADLVVVCSEGMKQDIESRFQFRHIIVVTNACDMQFFANAKQLPIAPEYRHKKLVVYTGSLGVMDHCMQIMEAAALLDAAQYPDLLFLIIGDGVEREMMMQFKEQRRLHHVQFLGLIPKTELAPLLAHAVCSIVCFKNVPVLNSVSPNKMFDAFAAGVPIVQTTQGWVKDMLEKSGAGITVLPDEPAQMLKAILNYVEDEASREMASANALALANTTFSRDNCAAKMIQHIAAIV